MPDGRCTQSPQAVFTIFALQDSNDVSHQTPPGIVRLTENRLIAALKEVPVSVLWVVVLACNGQDSLHNPADEIILHLD